MQARGMLAAAALLAAAGIGCSAVQDLSTSSGDSGLKNRTIANEVRPAAAVQGNFEIPGGVPAGKAARPVPVAGKDYTIENATADGFNYYFLIRTKYGDMDAYGVRDLKLRIAEIPAIAVLDKQNSAVEFAKGGVNSMMDSVRGAAHLVTNPVASAEAAKAGVAGVFESDKQPEPKDASSADSMEESKEFVSEWADDYVGYSEAKRKLAARLKVDPYSRNPLLQAQLKRVAAAQTTGSLATYAVPSPVVLDVLATANSVVWKDSEADVVKASYGQLRGMGVPAATTKALLKNSNYTRTEVTALVLALQKFKGRPGLAEAAARAAAVKTQSGATFQAQAAALLAQYDRKVAPIKALAVGNGLLINGVTADGTLVIPLGVDYLMWVPQIAARAAALSGKQKVELYVTGQVSPRAKDELGRLGVRVKENV